MSTIIPHATLMLDMRDNYVSYQPSFPCILHIWGISILGTAGKNPWSQRHVFGCCVRVKTHIPSITPEFGEFCLGVSIPRKTLQISCCALWPRQVKMSLWPRRLKDRLLLETTIWYATCHEIKTIRMNISLKSISITSAGKTAATWRREKEEIRKRKGGLSSSRSCWNQMFDMVFSAKILAC